MVIGHFALVSLNSFAPIACRIGIVALIRMRRGVRSRRDGSGEAVRQLRKLLLGIEPRCPLRSPNMRLGTIRDRRVKTPEPQDYGGLSRPLSHELRTAFRTKTADFAW